MQKFSCPEPVGGHRKKVQRHRQVEPERFDEKGPAPAGREYEKDKFVQLSKSQFSSIAGADYPPSDTKAFFRLRSVRMYCVHSLANSLFAPKYYELLQKGKL